jgi:beta-apo-4'-carotenal oxygenase
MAARSSIDKRSEVDIPAFTPTAVDSIPETCSAVRAGFRSLKTKDLDYRKVQLRKLYWGIKDHGAQLEEALMRDLRKSAYESRFTEIDWTANDCMFMLDNLDAFAKDEVAPVPFVFKPNKVRIRKEPLGSALIIGTYNFPFMLTVVPLVGAIAAGCTAVLKPSEGAPNVAMVIKSIVESCLDPEAYRVVIGAVPETTALLDQKWDKIFYTGSANVARIICKRAAENLTPVTLELGGRNPAFVTRNADLKLAAKRLLWAKTLCAGQVCLSQNYVLVERETVDEFIKQLNAASKQAFPNGAKAAPDLCRVINERHFLRMKKMVDESKGKIVMGGEMDQSELFIAPTAVLVNSVDDSMMKEESFGPVFCIIPFDNLGHAIDIANNVDPTPLALFGFGTREEFNTRM